MKYICDSKQMKAIDTYTIEEIGIPSLVLMERASLCVAEQMQTLVAAPARILVLCGTGNNGGDGMAVARILAQRGYTVDIFLPATGHRITKEAKKQFEIAKALAIPVYDQMDWDSRMSVYDGAIDAFFGIGLQRAIEEPYASAVQAVNSSGIPVVAVDMPSGIHTDNGKVCGVAVKADITVTFGYEKPGLLLYPGREYAGKVVACHIGFPEKQQLPEQLWPKYICYDEEDMKRLPKRPADSHKGTFGRVLVIAGSEGMSGACQFAARAAYRMGAGLVQIYTVESNRSILQSTIPEAIVSTYDNDFSDLESAYEQATAIICGCGIGVSSRSRKLLQKVLLLQQNHPSKSLVLDADALNILAEMSAEKGQSFLEVKRESSLFSSEFPMPKGCILTPHIKELSRLCGIPVKELAFNLWEVMNQIQDRIPGNCAVLAKDATTLVAGGNHLYMNVSGCHGMATGGSGDVLAGLIGGLLAQGMDTVEAARLGVFLHGRAGEQASDHRKAYSIMASDIIESIGVSS